MFFLIAIFSPLTLRSQSETTVRYATRMLHTEFSSGLSHAITLNYEFFKKVDKKKQSTILLRTGVRYRVDTSVNEFLDYDAIGFHIGPAFLIPPGKNLSIEFVTGLGADIPINSSLIGVIPYLIFDFGVRYQIPEGGPIIRLKIGFSGFGLGIGYAFKE